LRRAVNGHFCVPLKLVSRRRVAPLRTPLFLRADAHLVVPWECGTRPLAMLQWKNEDRTYGLVEEGREGVEARASGKGLSGRGAGVSGRIAVSSPRQWNAASSFSQAERPFSYRKVGFAGRSEAFGLLARPALGSLSPTTCVPIPGHPAPQAGARRRYPLDGVAPSGARPEVARRERKRHHFTPPAKVYPEA